MQIQTLKNQIDNMKLQINDIEQKYNTQKKDPKIMTNNWCGEQLINLSIQMFKFKLLIMEKA